MREIYVETMHNQEPNKDYDPNFKIFINYSNNLIIVDLQMIAGDKFCYWDAKS